MKRTTFKCGCPRTPENTSAWYEKKTGTIRFRCLTHHRGFAADYQRRIRLRVAVDALLQVALELAQAHLGVKAGQAATKAKPEPKPARRPDLCFKQGAELPPAERALWWDRHLKGQAALFGAGIVAQKYGLEYETVANLVGERESPC